MRRAIEFAPRPQPRAHNLKAYVLTKVFCAREGRSNAPTHPCTRSTGAGWAGGKSIGVQPGGRFAFSLGRRCASLWGWQFRLQIIGVLQAHALREAHQTLKWPRLGKIKGLARNQATPSVGLYSEAALTKPGLIQRRIVPDTHKD